MKFKCNGKEMKEAIESVVLKGKWNSGLNSKNDKLSSSIIISVSDNSYIVNGDNATFITKSINLTEIEKGFRFVVDSDILIKYLSDEVIGFKLDDNVLTMVTPYKTVKIPIMERHELNDAILFCEKWYQVNTDMEENVKISEKTTLETRIKLSSKELSKAIKDCDTVNNSVYKLDYDGENLIISSSKDNESVTVELEPIEAVGKKATMEFTCPFTKYLNNATVILSFNDESPLSVISGNFKLLRAPRIEA